MRKNIVISILIKYFQLRFLKQQVRKKYKKDMFKKKDINDMNYFERISSNQMKKCHPCKQKSKNL